MDKRSFFAMKKIPNLGLIVALLVTDAWSQAAKPAAPGLAIVQLASVVSGIVSYTRWPSAPHPIRLCVLGHPSLLEQLSLIGPPEPGQRSVKVQSIQANEDVLRLCDAVYVSAIPPENARLLLRQVVGTQVLTVGEGAEFCSDGGMFCMEFSEKPLAQPTAQRFSANLDAISRSGLRVNPQVLRLARAPKVPAP